MLESLPFNNHLQQTAVRYELIQIVFSERGHDILHPLYTHLCSPLRDSSVFDSSYVTIGLLFFGEGGGGYRFAEILVCPSMHLDRDRLGRDRMVVGLTKHHNRNPVYLDSLGGNILIR